jgi:hypothetical protein
MNKAMHILKFLILVLILDFVAYLLTTFQWSYGVVVSLDWVWVAIKLLILVVSIFLLRKMVKKRSERCRRLFILVIQISLALSFIDLMGELGGLSGMGMIGDFLNNLAFIIFIVNIFIRLHIIRKTREIDLNSKELVT